MKHLLFILLGIIAMAVGMVILYYVYHLFKAFWDMRILNCPAPVIPGLAAGLMFLCWSIGREIVNLIQGK